MELLITALGLYALGTLAIIWPKGLELAAHYTAMGLAAAASLVVLVVGLRSGKSLKEIHGEETQRIERGGRQEENQ